MRHASLGVAAGALVAIVLSTTAVRTSAAAAQAGAVQNLAGDAVRAHVDYVSRPDAGAPVSVIVHLPLRNRTQLEAFVAAQARLRPAQRHYLTPAAFRANYGVRPADAAAAARAFGPAGLRVVSTGAQDVTLEGSRSAVEAALHTQLWNARNAAGRLTIGAKSSFVLPSALGGAAVVNLSSAVIKHVHSARVPQLGAGGTSGPHSELSPVGGYLTSDLKQAYAYPSYELLRGRNATIAILVDGDFLDADMSLYFSTQHLPVPTLVRRPVDGGAPHTKSDSEETELDIQQSGGIAPGATIVHYNIPDLSDTNIYKGLKAIVDDDVADIVNTSFGACEAYYDGQYVLALGPGAVPGTLFAENDEILQGVSQGQTFVASSGDNGAFPCFAPHGPNTIASVEFPASSPWETGVGGTNLVTTYSAGSTQSAYVRENAFGDQANLEYSLVNWGSGGGESRFFPEPFYQTAYHIPSRLGRPVPDVAGHMGGCPWYAVTPCGPDRSTDLLAYNSSFVGVIGTSAAAPDFAGLVALTIEADGSRLGLVNPTLYTLGATNGQPVNYFNTNVPGSNGIPTHPGYNEVTGNGSINGLAFTGLLAGAVAGKPGTPSNPGPRVGAAPSEALHITSQPDRLVLAGARDVIASRATPIGIDTALPAPPRSGFDALSGRCALTHMGFMTPGPTCHAGDLGLAAGPAGLIAVLPDQAAVYDFSGKLAAGWPKSLGDLLGPTFVYQETPLCALSTQCRAFTNVHAAYDPSAHRYWISVVEYDSDPNSSVQPKGSQWIAVSATSDPGGVWHAYQYRYPTGGTISSRGAGFGFTQNAVVLTADVIAPGMVSIDDPAFAYVVALDKAHLEAGMTTPAIGVSHVADRGVELLSIAPAVPQTAADETTAAPLLVSTYARSAYRAGCSPVTPCSAALISTLRDPLGTPQLAAATAAVPSYRQPPDAWDGFEASDGAVLATPVLAHDTLTFSFDSGEFGAAGLVNGFVWAQVEPTDGPGAAFAARTLAFGAFRSPLPATDLAFATVTPDGGAFDFTYASLGARIQTYAQRRLPVGRFAPPQLLASSAFGVQSTFAFSYKLYDGHAAAASYGGRTWFIMPYASGWSAFIDSMP